MRLMPRSLFARLACLLVAAVAVALAASTWLMHRDRGEQYLRSRIEFNAHRLTDLARRAGMSKQAMGTLVAQCEAWGMVTRTPDPADARARQVRSTAFAVRRVRHPQFVQLHQTAPISTSDLSKLQDSL